MKKYFYFFMALCLSMSCVLISCGDDDEETSGGVDGPTNNDPALTEAEQKSKLSNTATTLMNMISVSDFRPIVDVAESLDKSNTDDSVLDNWLEACVDVCDISSNDSDNEKWLWAASNFKGTFERSNYAWKQSKKDGDLTFIFYDNNNKKCIATLITSGKETEVHHDAFDTEEWDYYYNYNSGYYDYKEWFVENRFKIPENIHVTLTQNGNTLAEVTVTTSIMISSPSGEVNLKTDRVEISTSVRVNKYEVIVEKACYSNTNIYATTRVLIDEKPVIQSSIDAVGKLEVDYPENSNGKVNIEYDILGEVQLRGTISDIKAFINTSESLDEYYRDEKNFKGAVEKLNELFDLKLFFGGSSNPSANLRLVVYKDEYSYYDSYDCRAVVSFGDGTAYSPLDSYFSEGYFKSVINQFMSLVEDFEKLAN